MPVSPNTSRLSSWCSSAPASEADMWSSFGYFAFDALFRSVTVWRNLRQPPTVHHHRFGRRRAAPRNMAVSSTDSRELLLVSIKDMHELDSSERRSDFGPSPLIIAVPLPNLQTAKLVACG